MEQISLKDWMVRFFFFLLCCFMINRLFFFSPSIAEVTSSYILYPLIKLQKTCTDPIVSYTTRQHEIATLQQQVAALQEKNNDLQAQLIATHAVIDFEQRSAQARAFEQRYNFDIQKMVQVLLRSFDDAGHFFWVDAGSNQGIAVNMIAVYKNTIVGRVVHVDALYSKIALITDSRCKIAAHCAQTKTVGVYQGTNHATGTLEFVPHYAPVQVGDMVVSTGQGLVYPQGFGIGVITSCSVDDVAYTIVVQPLVDLTTIDCIYLIAV